MKKIRSGPEVSVSMDCLQRRNIYSAEFFELLKIFVFERSNGQKKLSIFFLN